MAAQLHEASQRLGGRCWSGTLGAQVYEHGGELIDQGHTQVRQLAQSLGLTLDNLLAAEQNGTEPLFNFDGQPYTFTQAKNDLQAVWQKIHSDVSAASYPTLYNVSTERGRELDAMSIVDWINESVPGGITSRLGQLLDVAYNIEYGAESNVQSSLNLLYLLGYQGPGQLRIFGKSNEKYHVTGGNDQIPAALGERLAGQITMKEGRLQPAEDDRDPRAGHGHELQAPCAVLVTALARPGLQRRHVRGHRLPEHLGGHARPARDGRDPGRLHGRDDRRELRQRHPGQQGAAVLRPDRAAPAGAERERSGNVHFAGEHTSIDFQGYLNGAVESGERVATEILADLK